MRGYVIILVEGYFLEKFLNICTRRQIFLWDIKRRDEYSLVLKISIKGFKMLKPILRKTGCRARIIRKNGIPFISNRYRKRKAFIVGALVFVMLFYLLSSFIWDVDIKGNKNLDTQLIADKLASLGVKPGALKYGIDTSKVVNEMMLSIKELAWIGIVVRGTKVKVEVVERVMPPQLVPKDKPCNIIAARDGVIKTIIAKAGQEMVKAGDTVSKGQVLISGEIKSKTDEKKIRLVHAVGVVKARTWHEGMCPVRTKIYEKERTGRVINNISLIMFTKRFDLFPKKVEFSDFEKVEFKKTLAIGEDFTLPFGLLDTIYYEDMLVERELDLEEAKQAAFETANKKAQEEIGENAEIVKTSSNFLTGDDGELTADVIIECIEDIGVTEEIGGN